jgi:AraC family ethanolamine operon transcriptional activator
MKTPSASTTESAVSITVLTDPTAASDDIEVLDQDVISLDKEPFLTRRIVVRLEGSVLLFHEVRHRLRSYTKLDSDKQAFFAIAPRAKGDIDGVAMRPDTLIAAEPGREAELVVEAGYSSAALVLRPEYLQEHLAARGRSADFSVPNGITFLQNTTQTKHAFFKLGSQIARTAERKPNLFASIRASAEIDLLEILLEFLGKNVQIPPTKMDIKRNQFSQIVKKVTVYAEENIENQLYISDLCRVANVSERTLQYIFRDIMGMTPMAYLKLLKLHRVRDDLRAGTRESTTVSNLAMKWGFWHFGDFSQTYKKCFHESPSTTLKTPLLASRT